MVSFSGVLGRGFADGGVVVSQGVPQDLYSPSTGGDLLLL